MTDPAIAKIQEIQALHRRILRARDAGEAPAPADLAAADQINADPKYRGFNRVWSRDEN